MEGDLWHFRFLLVSFAHARVKGEPLKKPTIKTVDELRPEYDLKELLKNAEIGKYAARLGVSRNLVEIEPANHRVFKTAKQVNDALRLVIELQKIGDASTTVR